MISPLSILNFKFCCFKITYLHLKLIDIFIGEEITFHKLLDLVNLFQRTEENDSENQVQCGANHTTVHPEDIDLETALSLSTEETSTVVEIEETPVEPDSKVGLTLGVLADIGITESFSIQPELDFVQKGSKIAADDFWSQSWAIGTTGEGVFGANDEFVLAISQPLRAVRPRD